VFEAASENPELKVKLFTEIDRNNPNQPWFFSNTSSIPIGYLDREAGLGGRVLGVHFYNPPAVQRLVEVIRCDATQPELSEFAARFIKNLRKIEVPAYDVAGFIGNGHFMRDALYGLSEAGRLAKEMPWAEAVYVVNKITQEWLIRPMGIFQLIDYVGIDVCQYIMKVMEPYVKDEKIHSPILDLYLEQGIRGGQRSDGSQKDGFLKYEKGKPAAIYDPETRGWVPVSEVSAAGDAFLGNPPSSVIAWKNAVSHPDRDALFRAYFADLRKEATAGASLALAYARRSLEIGKKLVADAVAYSEKVVNTVLLSGFFHAYGTINDYLSEEEGL
jgi:3-hydroxyacyl-CoA dehydrogenase